MILCDLPNHGTMKAKSQNKAPKGTHSGDVMGGSCGPGKAFRRFFMRERR